VAGGTVVSMRSAGFVSSKKSGLLTWLGKASQRERQPLEAIEFRLTLSKRSLGCGDALVQERVVHVTDMKTPRRDLVTHPREDLGCVLVAHGRKTAFRRTFDRFFGRVFFSMAKARFAPLQELRQERSLPAHLSEPCAVFDLIATITSFTKLVSFSLQKCSASK